MVQKMGHFLVSRAGRRSKSQLMERVMIFVGVLFLVCLVGLGLAMRLWAPASLDLHQDPAMAQDPGPQGVKLTGDTALQFSVSDKDLEEIVRSHAADWPSSERLSDDGGFTTYLTRTGVFQFPDTFSFRVTSIDETTSQLEILARSRFGSYDWGLNRARVDRLVEEIEQTIRER